MEDFSSANLKRRYETVINALTFGMPFHCAACGLRLPDRPSYRGHLDAHFLKNSGARKARQMGPVSRRWFPSPSQWLAAMGPSSSSSSPPPEDSRTNKRARDPDEGRGRERSRPFALMDDAHPACGLCGERFEVFLHPEMEEWCYSGAVDFRPGGLAHWACMPAGIPAGQ